LGLDDYVGKRERRLKVEKKLSEDGYRPRRVHNGTEETSLFRKGKKTQVERGGGHQGSVPNLARYWQNFGTGRAWGQKRKEKEAGPLFVRDSGNIEGSMK